jgi:hypothetical protein
VIFVAGFIHGDAKYNSAGVEGHAEYCPKSPLGTRFCASQTPQVIKIMIKQHSLFIATKNYG